MLAQKNITELLRASQGGDAGAAGHLLDAVYTELRRVARHRMAAERPAHTLQPTELVNEVFLKMFHVAQTNGAWRPPSINWESRAHFLAVAARQMRLVLIDHARQKRAAKRAGVRVSFDDAIGIATPVAHEVETIDLLIRSLEEQDPRAGRVVELKFFGGLTDREVAAALSTNVAQVRRDWVFARAWLRQRLSNVEKG